MTQLINVQDPSQGGLFEIDKIKAVQAAQIRMQAEA